MPFIGATVIMDFYKRSTVEATDSIFENLDRCAVAVWAANRYGGEPTALTDWTPLSQPDGCVSLFL